jgi:actin-binding protein anillin
LNISSSSFPLTGLLYVSLRCTPSKSIELRGFITLFEDVNGVGAWDRRWCFLDNYNISYWKYPDDEFKTNPIGVINLNNVINKDKLSILPRDLCARKYSIELLVQQQSQMKTNGDDSNSNNNEPKIKQYRLSADNKEQAEEWLLNLNYALTILRLWSPSK